MLLLLLLFVTSWCRVTFGALLRGLNAKAVFEAGMKSSTWLLHRILGGCERDLRCRLLAHGVCGCGGISLQNLSTRTRRLSTASGDNGTSPLLRLVKAKVHGFWSCTARDCGRLGTILRTFSSRATVDFLLVEPNSAGNGPTQRDESIACVVEMLQQQPWGPDLEDALDEMQARITQVVVTEVLKQQTHVRTALNFLRWVDSRRPLLLTCSAHSALLKLVCKTQKFEEVPAILKAMRKRGCSMESAFTTLVTGYGKAKKFQEAVEVLNTMSKFGCIPNVITYNCLINMLVESGNHTTCLQVFQKMLGTGCTPNSYTYTCMMNSFTRQGDVDSAHNLFKEMKEKDCDPNVLTYSALIQGFTKANQIAEAWLHFQEMKTKGLDPTAYCYGVLLSALWKEKLVEHAEEIFEEMKEREMVNVFAYNVMIDGYGITGEPCKACELFEEMKVQKVDPDACTFNTLISLLVKARRMGDACRYFEMLKEVQKPDVIAYNCIIDGFFKEPGHVEDAEKYFEDMKEQGVAPDHFTYNILIDGFERAERRHDAQATVEEMKARGLKLTVIVYNILINSYGKEEDLEKCLQIFKEMKVNGIRPDLITYNTLIDVCGKVHKTSQGLKLLAEMKGVGISPDVVTYSTLIDGLGKSGQAHHARRLFREMKNSGIEPNRIAYNAYIDALGCAGHPSEACLVFQEMKRKGVLPDVVTYTTLMNWLEHANEKVLMCRLFEDMESSGCCPDELTFEVLGRGNTTRSHQLVNWKVKVPRPSRHT